MQQHFLEIILQYLFAHACKEDLAKKCTFQKHLQVPATLIAYIYINVVCNISEHLLQREDCTMTVSIVVVGQYTQRF